ncbi:alpha/beta hydrolase [uncultured Jatrophihabitans sp.]|uniref:alpha/beta hydrolase n=1 Tax=uncultured Jatrophihabitans sp. TaxID=1610747 RepID=UPI0035CC5831
MSLPLRTKVFWSIYRRVERDPVMQQGADKVRAASDRRRKMSRMPGSSLLTGRPDRGAVAEDTAATLPDGTTLPLRIYRPQVRTTDAAADALPVVMYFHGGGWVSGDPWQSEWWCAGVAAGAGAVVVSVDYRLAPEHPFPTPVEDCYAATVWVAEHARELGVDADRLAVMGDSAGGNAAAVVSLMARDRGGPRIRLQALIYPSVDLGADYPSKHENADAPVLTRKDLDTTWHLYLPDESKMHDPYASPLYAEHHDLPPALIQTAQYDPLRDQGAVYAAALRAAGVSVRLTNYVRAVHGYVSLRNVTIGADQALGEAVAVLEDALVERSADVVAPAE